MILSSLLSLMMVFAPLPDSAPDPVDPVRLENGAVQGAVSGDVVAFKGLPYAAPPVGERRWRPPAPAPDWDGVRDATDYGALCIQPPANGDPGVAPCR